ncbi:MAG: DUF559 domain-containing protein, partial [Dialister sp.]|nr:DUF559 domain-containing protein [Dialister sp.]
MLRRRPPVDSALKQRARELRNHMTQEEKKIWYQYLNHCGYSFKRQYVIPPFIVDFYCADAALAVEIDGSQHFMKDGAAHDYRRTVFMKQFGILVLRFMNKEILTNLSGVC